MATAIASEPEYYTPPQLARIYGVAIDKIIRWILAGELEAMNFATAADGLNAKGQPRRPRYKITRAAKESFEERRRVLSPPPRPQAQVRRKKPAAKDPSYVTYV